MTLVVSCRRNENVRNVDTHTPLSFNLLDMARDGECEWYRTHLKRRHESSTLHFSARSVLHACVVNVIREARYAAFCAKEANPAFFAGHDAKGRASDASHERAAVVQAPCDRMAA